MTRKKKQLNVVIAIPTMGMVNFHTFDNYMEFFYNLGKMEEKNSAYKFHIWTSPRLLTAIAREELAARALEAKMDYILFMDDDMIVPKDIFERLIAHDVDIVGALAFTRLGDHLPVMYRYKVNKVKKGKDKVLRYCLQFHQIDDYDKQPPGLYECDAIGFGVVLLKVNILKKIPKPWFMAQMQLGEDIYFCNKAREMKIKVYMDTSVKTAHVGNPEVITEETFKLFRKMKHENSNSDTNVLPTGPAKKLPAESSSVD